MMVVLEAAMLTVLVMLLIHTARSDCKRDLIENQSLLIAAAMLLPMDALYYWLYGSEWLSSFGVNFMVLAIAGVFFYAQHIWGAGDSKLLFVIGLAIPGRLYAEGRLGLGAGLVIIAMAFIAAFIWILLHGIWQGIKQHNLLKLPQRYFDLKRMLASYVLVVSLMQILDRACRLMLPNELLSSPYIARGIYFAVLLWLIAWRNSLPIKRLYGLAAMAFFLMIAFFAVWGLPQFVFSVFVLVAVVGLFFVRMMIEKYNYQSIPTATVRSGQILSAATVLSFAPSQVRGLPTNLSEDMEAKLTEEEAASVRRWEKSKYGRASVVIVRKIPFAIFLGIGVLAMLVLEVWSR